MTNPQSDDGDSVITHKILTGQGTIYVMDDTQYHSRMIGKAYLVIKTEHSFARVGDLIQMIDGNMRLVRTGGLQRHWRLRSMVRQCHSSSTQ
jgi:hypothetical protein